MHAASTYLLHKLQRDPDDRVLEPLAKIPCIQVKTAASSHKLAMRFRPGHFATVMILKSAPMRVHRTCPLSPGHEVADTHNSGIRPPFKDLDDPLDPFTVLGRHVIIRTAVSQESEHEILRSGAEAAVLPSSIPLVATHQLEE